MPAKPEGLPALECSQGWGIGALGSVSELMTSDGESLQALIWLALLAFLRCRIRAYHRPALVR